MLKQLDWQAVFSDCSANFVSNPEPMPGERIKISIRCKTGDAESVYFRISGFSMPMIKTSSDQVFDYYTANVRIEEKIRYYFSIKAHGSDDIFYYTLRGLSKEKKFNQEYPFTLIPGYKTPDWAKSAVMYQIFVDRFYNGDPSNDVKNNEYLYLGELAKKVEDWNAPIENKDFCRFYGGDLQGIIDKMAYLKELGIDAIYFNPLFVSPSNHKYDKQDYDYIDPHYGVIINDGGKPLNFEYLNNKHASMYIKRTTDKENLEASNALMVKLIELAHQNGIKVILDGVFNHCGAFHKWLDREGFYKDEVRGAYVSADSPYRDHFLWHRYDWPNNDSYDAWWAHHNHPKLNFEDSPKLYDYILEVAAKWVSPPFNADGWRLDVAADLGRSKAFNHKFWKDFRVAVKTANPDALILAEHYGDPTDWLDGSQWDSVMNYDAFMEPMSWFFTGMQKHSEDYKDFMRNNAEAFEGAMLHFMAKMPYPSTLTAMNQISNHDHSRFLTRTNRRAGRLHTVGHKAADEGIDRAVMMSAVAMQFTWPGSPTIYYGDEAGQTGWTDPDNRRTFPWGKEDHGLIAFHKTIIALHKQSSALKKGSVIFLYLGHGTIAYGRWDAAESIICIFNNNEYVADIDIPVWRANVPLDAICTRILTTDDGEFDTSAQDYKVTNGILRMNLASTSSTVLRFAF